jgi:Ca2+/Na+ antiporter
MLTFILGLLVLAASCYILFILSDPLERIGGQLGKLLRLPEDVIASTFQALATSGPEIVMAILAATPYIALEAWEILQMGEKACSGTLNMLFSAMDNLLGIGAVAIIFMISKGMAKKDEKICVEPSVKISLIFYILASVLLAIYILDKQLTVTESWSLMIIGIVYVLSQFFIPGIIKRMNNNGKNSGFLTANSKAEADDDDEDDYKAPTTVAKWSKELIAKSFLYAFLVFALIVFVREAMGATFKMAMFSTFSLGGILLMFTSYVSSFPEFMMTYRYAIANKKSALLGMLFGSNVIDLAFSGFRSLWLNQPMEVISTGKYGHLLPIYVWVIPAMAVLALIGLWTKTLKYKIAYPLVIFYLFYIVSGFILL